MNAPALIVRQMMLAGKKEEPVAAAASAALANYLCSKFVTKYNAASKVVGPQPQKSKAVSHCHKFPQSQLQLISEVQHGLSPKLWVTLNILSTLSLYARVTHASKCVQKCVQMCAEMH